MYKNTAATVSFGSHLTAAKLIWVRGWLDVDCRHQQSMIMEMDGRLIQSKHEKL